MCDNDGVCDDAGNCVECNRSAQCSDDGNDCTNAVCNVEMDGCETVHKMDGIECDFAGDQGACKSGMCEAAPCDLTPCQDGNECTVASCPDGASNCSFVNVEPGDKCTQNGGQVCDGAGECVECNNDQHCTDDDGNECTRAACDAVNNICGDVPVADGEPCNGGVDQCLAGVCVPSSGRRFAYVTNRDSHNVSQYSIGTGGKLTPLIPNEAAAGQTPSSVTAMGDLK